MPRKLKSITKTINGTSVFTNEELEYYRIPAMFVRASAMFIEDMCGLFNIKKQQQLKGKVIDSNNFKEFKFSTTIVNDINFPQELLLLKRFLRASEIAGEVNDETQMKKILTMSLDSKVKTYADYMSKSYHTSISKVIKFRILDIKEEVYKRQVAWLVNIMVDILILRDILNDREDKDIGMRTTFTAKQIKEFRSLTTQLSNRLGNVMYRLCGDVVNKSDLIKEYNYYLEMERLKYVRIKERYFKDKE